MSKFDSYLKDSEAFFSLCLEIMKNKNNDYADTDDVFYNFKETAKIAGIKPSQVVLVQLGNKLARLNQLIGKDKEPLNEALSDTLLDIINYTLLLRGILNEQKTENVTKSN